jgi:hypothetical protein
VRHNLQRLSPTDGFEVASIDDVLSLLHWEGRLGIETNSCSDAAN